VAVASQQPPNCPNRKPKWWTTRGGLVIADTNTGRVHVSPPFRHLLRQQITAGNIYRPAESPNVAAPARCHNLLGAEGRAGGSEGAFSRLWRDGNPALLRYLRVIVPGSAEDVAADTWVQVVRGLAGFRGDERGWRAWLFTTAPAGGR
jgi:hypothetical protein